MLDDRSLFPEIPSTLQPRDALAAMVRAWRRERQLRAAVRTLAALSDHTLRDMGLERGGINSAVRSGRDAG